MLSICIHRRCKREREKGLPFCGIHWTDQLLSSKFTNRNNSPALTNIIPLSKGLTRAERLLLILIYREGFSPKEVGYALDLSESTVRNMHRKILDGLYSHFKDSSEVIYPFSPEVNKSHIVQIREFNHELITFLAEHPNYMYNFNPRKFERFIAHILETVGFNVELTAPTRDGGCDIIAFSVNELGIQSKYIVECKRYRPDCPVGVRLVRSLYGIKDLKQAQHAILATTSYFTRDAIAFAENPSVLGLHLKDVNDISEWLKQCYKENTSQSFDNTR